MKLISLPVMIAVMALLGSHSGLKIDMDTYLQEKSNGLETHHQTMEENNEEMEDEAA